MRRRRARVVRRRTRHELGTVRDAAQLPDRRRARGARGRRRAATGRSRSSTPSSSSIDATAGLVTCGRSKASSAGTRDPDARRRRHPVPRALRGVPRDELRRARAIAGGQLAVRLRSPRDFGLGKHKSVDDTPYGGGSGMVMRVDVLVAAMESLDADAPPMAARAALLITPQGAPFDQAHAPSASPSAPAITLVCGRYEGFDERVRAHVDEEISLGDFVMTGGEVAAMAVIDACVRLLPGVLGNEDVDARGVAQPDDGGLLEYPQYTRPAEFRGERRARGARRRQPRRDRQVAPRAGARAHAGAAARSVSAAARREPETPVRRARDRARALPGARRAGRRRHDRDHEPRRARSRRAARGRTAARTISSCTPSRRSASSSAADPRITGSTGSSGKRIPDRKAALALVRTVPSLEDVVRALGGRAAIEVWATAARDARRRRSRSREARARLLEGEGSPC